MGPLAALIQLTERTRFTAEERVFLWNAGHRGHVLGCKTCLSGPCAQERLPGHSEM